jgi:hypothetical protein
MMCASIDLKWVPLRQEEKDSSQRKVEGQEIFFFLFFHFRQREVENKDNEQGNEATLDP